MEPVVSCALGKLYNKDALLEYLLDKSAYGDGEKICGHVRSLKVRFPVSLSTPAPWCSFNWQDVKTLKLTPNPTPPSPSADPLDHARFICPLTLKEMNGQQPFVYISPCGCVLSSAGFKALSSGSGSGAKEGELEMCPQCATKFSRSTDVVTLNPGVDEEEKMMERLLVKRAQEKKEKKSNGNGKKRKKEGEDAPAEKPAKKAAPVSSVHPSVTASVASSLAMEEAKRKASMSDAVKSLYGDGKKKTKETFMTMGTFTRVSPQLLIPG